MHKGHKGLYRKFGSFASSMGPETHILFFNTICYENHLRIGSYNRLSSVCKKIKICKICLKTVRPKKRTNERSHECGVSFCNVCKMRLPIRHFCQPIVKPTKNENVLFVFYDFETQQNISILGDEEKKFISSICVSCNKLAPIVWKYPMFRLCVTSVEFANSFLTEIQLNN